MLKLVQRLPQLAEINQQLSDEYFEFNKEIVEVIYSFYIDLNDMLKVLFLKNILGIVLDNSDDYELPFN